MSKSIPKRVLALDVRPRSFGYVVFEGPEMLLEWGAKSFRGGVNAVKIPVDVKLAGLLQEFAPDLIVVRQSPRSKARTTAKLAKSIRAIRSIAKTNRVALRTVPWRGVWKAFGEVPGITRYQIASIVANHYPELGFRLPPPRKCWQSEDYRMSIFDAAAVGMAYFMELNNRKRKFPTPS